MVLFVCLAATFARGAEGSHINDREITLAVLRGLARDEGIPEHRIDVETDDGVVMLEGSVHSLRAADRARRTVETVRGVLSVINRLRVQPVPRSDSEIKKEVTAVLEDDQAIDEDDISISVTNGRVILTGVTTSWAGKRLCSASVRGLRGVRALQNDLVIQESFRQSDEQLKTDIERRLSMSVWTTDADVKVEVQDGSVTFVGLVGSATQKTRIKNLALLTGARSVDVERVEVTPMKQDEMRRKSLPDGLTKTTIHEAVRDAFRMDPRIKPEDIEIQVHDGVVTLTGRVRSARAKEAAEDDAFHTLGVKEVENYLRARPASSFSDAKLSARVQDALLRDADVDRLDIDVSIRNGKVYLYGVADSAYVKEKAEEAAGRVAGVVAVDANGLTVRDRPQEVADDESIRKSIESELWWNAFVDEDAINVEVDAGAATLTGTAADAHARDLATTEAYEGGARVVYNKLKMNE